MVLAAKCNKIDAISKGVTVFSVCRNKESPHYNNRVPQNCALCNPTVPTPVVVQVTSWTHISDNLEATLLPPTGADRVVHFNTDGSIEYTNDGNWEPPREITGYVRDPKNKLKFVPLWPPCSLRSQMAWRYKNCGCIGIRLRCNHPECKKFADVVTPDICNKCELRNP